jgi:hypothetical protein
VAKRAKAQQTASQKSSAAASGAHEQAPSNPTPSQDAVAMLSNDHRTVEQLFEKFKAATDADEKLQLVRQLCTEFSVHSLLEEELFYPACRGKGVEQDELDQAQVEHDGAKVLCADLRGGHPDEPFYDAKVQVLCEYVKHHVGEEENPQEGIFAKARSAGVDLNALGQQLQQRKQELMAGAQGRGVFIAPIRSLGNSSNQTQQSEDQMSRQYDERERDDQGRFMEREDRYSSRRGGEDEGRRSGGGHGWRGESEGHSRASERGWEERGGGRGSSSRERYEGDDDGRYASRGRDSSFRSERYEDDDDGRSDRGRGQGGWFGDSEGHSRASERGWEERGGQRGSGSQGSSVRRGGRYEEEDDGRSRQGRGWYGDSDGHSRAAERGWERGHESQRGSGGRGEGGRSSEGRGGQGHGGWFGDSEGHAEAARRRWER